MIPVVQLSLIYPTNPGDVLPRLPDPSKNAAFTFGSLEPVTTVKGPSRTPLKLKENTPTPSKKIDMTPKEPQSGFLWRSGQKDKSVVEPTALNFAEITEQPSKRGHRTSAIPLGIWEAAKLSPPKRSSLRRGRIFPLLLTCTGEVQNAIAFRVLAENESPLRHPVAMRQLTVLDS
ncbi:hypothetical protein M758_UG184600 [Ceratodon purpureus]|nr:hypothetical protein M758_UG184600 [Ceratodon purpureus]